MFSELQLNVLFNLSNFCLYHRVRPSWVVNYENIKLEGYEGVAKTLNLLISVFFTIVYFISLIS